MGIFKSIYFLISAVMLCACASSTVALYGAKSNQRQDNATIAGGNIYKAKALRWGYYTYSYLRVTSINGESVGAAQDFIVPPGKYKISTILTTPGDDTGTVRQTYLTGNFEEEIEVLAGHTYIPNGIIKGEVGKVYFDDVGANFKQECLPTNIMSREINGDKSVRC